MQEWYLMTPETRPNITGGFENESHVNYKKDAFDESLQTDIATTVTLFKSNLTDGKSVRCIIQGNIADTQLKSFERIGLFQIGRNMILLLMDRQVRTLLLSLIL